MNRIPGRKLGSALEASRPIAWPFSSTLSVGLNGLEGNVRV